jgi:hypothetical protein
VAQQRAYVAIVPSSVVIRVKAAVIVETVVCSIRQGQHSYVLQTTRHQQAGIMILLEVNHQAYYINTNA